MTADAILALARDEVQAAGRPPTDANVARWLACLVEAMARGYSPGMARATPEHLKTPAKPQPPAVLP